MKISKMLKGSLFYYLFSNIVSASISVFLVFYLSNNLSTEEYGFIIFFQALVSGINSVVGSGISNFCERRFFVTDNHYKFSEYITSSLSLNFSTSILILFILFFLKITGLLFNGIGDLYFFLAFFTAFFNAFISLRLGIWVIEKRSSLFFLFNTFQNLFSLVITLFLLNILDLGSDSRIYAITFSTFIFFILSSIFFKNDGYIYFKFFDFRIIKLILSEVITLWPHSVGLYLLNTYDRLYIASVFGMKEAAIWGFAAQIAGIVSLFLDGLNKIYVPWLFKKLSSSSLEERENIKSLTKVVIVSVVTISVISYYLVEPLFVIFGKKYLESMGLFRVMLISQIFSVLYFYYINFIFFTGKNKLISIVSVLSGILYVAILPLVDTHFGLNGIAWLLFIIIFLRIIYLSFATAKFFPWLSFGGFKNN
jgi:O-antigen/teichoic acid export membrane protein